MAKKEKYQISPKITKTFSRSFYSGELDSNSLNKLLTKILEAFPEELRTNPNHKANITVSRSCNCYSEYCSCSGIELCGRWERDKTPEEIQQETTNLELQTKLQRDAARDRRKKREESEKQEYERLRKKFEKKNHD